MNDRLLACIILWGVGVLVLIIAYMIGVKGKIGLLHSYHYAHVKEKDKKSYTRVMGVGLGIIGSGLVIDGGLDYFVETTFGNAFMAAGFLVGLGICIYGQYRYNGSIFS